MVDISIDFNIAHLTIHLQIPLTRLFTLLTSDPGNTSGVYTGIQIIKKLATIF